MATLASKSKIRREIEREAPDLASAFGFDVEHVTVETLPALSSSDVVQRALSDAEHLLRTSGPISAVDRLHTAIHGYFRFLCADVSGEATKDASLTALFKILRNDHPSLQFLGDHDKDMVRVLNGFANVLDAINSLRNNASVAHPNESLLQEPEALLALNATKTIFNYMRVKVGR